LPLLGFQNYLQLAEEIEEVYHVAAYVNSVLPYFSLKKSNVEGKFGESNPF
jgi:thioester reductase-like protein